MSQHKVKDDEWRKRQREEVERIRLLRDPRRINPFDQKIGYWGRNLVTGI